MSKLKCGIIGFGGLGKIHFFNLVKNENVEIVALCDVEEKQFTEAKDTNQGKGEAPLDVSMYHLYSDAEEMLEKENLDLVVVALPTYLHAKYSIMALNKGAHVFCEKPMARTVEECQEMIKAAKANNRQLAIGQCVRFNKVFEYVKEAIDDGKHGKLLRLELCRYGFAPKWGWDNWYMDFKRSGGAALDLHVHDVDYINSVFGRPTAVQSEAIHRISGFDCMQTRYFYDNTDAIIRATGDWSMPISYGFKPSVFAQFEDALIVNTPTGYIIYPNEGEEIKIDNDPSYSGYNAEMALFVDCIIAGKPNVKVLPESTAQSIEIVFAEMKSADTKERVEL